MAILTGIHTNKNSSCLLENVISLLLLKRYDLLYFSSTYTMHCLHQFRGKIPKSCKASGLAKISNTFSRVGNFS